MATATLVRPGRSTRTAGRWRFTTDEYYRLWETGFFPEEARTELIGGVIYEMPVPGHEHVFSTTYLTTLLARNTPTSMFVGSQSPLVLSDDTVVQPDVMIIHGEAMAEPRRMTAPDVLLVVEIVFSTEYHDRRRKLPRYARTLVPEVWLVLVARERIEVHREPVDGVYTSVTAHERGDVVSPAAAPDLVLAVADVLGKRG